MENTVELLEDTMESILQSYTKAGQTIVIGVSGGVDSTALLHLIEEPAKKMDLKVIVAHVNHQLRGKESDKDAEFVQKMAEKLGFPCVVEKVEVKKLQKTQKISLEDAGRQARYTFFYQMKEEHGASFIVLAHHRDDNVETVLLNLVRGAGIRGLTGMDLVNTKAILRPLIDFSKEELLEYCTEKKLEYREDATNKDTKIRRNYIRHKLIPSLEKMNPRFREMIHKKSFYFEEIDDLLTILSLDFIKKYCKIDEKKIIFSVQTFRKTLPAIQRAIIQTIYEIFHGSTNGLSYDQVEELVRTLYKNRTGAEKILGNRLSLTIAYGKGIFQREQEEKSESLPEKLYQIPIPGIFQYAGGKIITRVKKNVPKNRKKNTIYISAKDKNMPIFIRKFQPGDRFRPFGMTGTKKIQDLFVDEKIPRTLRSNIPILTDQQGQIVAVGNLRIDRSYHPNILPGVIVEIEFQI